MKHWSKFDIPRKTLLKMSEKERKELGFGLPRNTVSKNSEKPEKDNPYQLFIDTLIHIGLPTPVTEYQFAPPRKWRWDVCFPDSEHKLAMEIDGGIWSKGRHVRGGGFIKDMEKQNAGVMLGWSLLRFTPDQVRCGYAVDMIKRWFSRKDK